jgi:hypothetical protein
MSHKPEKDGYVLEPNIAKKSLKLPKTLDRLQPHNQSILTILILH